MLQQVKLFVVIITIWNIFLTPVVHGEDLKNCSITTQPVSDCPENSLCTKVNTTEEYKCVCATNFTLNTNWKLHLKLLNISSFYCRPHPSFDDDVTENKENKILIYIRSPAKGEHLAVGILMVLLAAVLAVAIIVLLQMLRPLKRTKTVYMKIKQRRRNRHPLQEFDELDMTRRDINAQLE